MDGHRQPLTVRSRKEAHLEVASRVLAALIASEKSDEKHGSNLPRHAWEMAQDLIEINDRFYNALTGGSNG